MSAPRRPGRASAPRPGRWPARFSRRSRPLALAVVLSALSCADAIEPVIPVPTTVQLSVSELSFASLGETVRVTAAVLDQEGASIAGAPVAWAVDDMSVASVSADGELTAVGNGETQLRVSSGTASIAAGVHVGQVPTTLTLGADSALLEALGDTVRLAVSVTDLLGSDVEDAPVWFLSLDPAVASVDADGLVTAVGNGTTVVAATSGPLIGLTTVEVAQASGSVGLSDASITFAALGDTLRLSAAVLDPGGSPFEDAPVAWSSSDTTVAVVSAEGLVTSVRNGHAVVTATSGPAHQDTDVDVEQVVTAVTLEPDSIVFEDVAEAVALTAVALDALGATVEAATLSFGSDDDGIASVDADGVVTSVATGTATITAEADGVTSSIDARVVPELTLAASSPTAQTAEVATSVSLSVLVEAVGGGAQEGANVTWAVNGGGGAITSETDVPTDASGHAGAVWRLGTLTVPQTVTASIQTRGASVDVAFSATATPGPAATAELVADSVLLSARGETVFLGPTLRDEYGNAGATGAVSWATSDPGVALVSIDGLVTGQAEGETHVTPSIDGEAIDSILVTVDHRGGITITFDDGWLTTYDVAWPVLQEYGLLANVGVYTEAVDGSFPAYMSESQLQELHDDGWSLVSHTASHDDLTLLSDPVLDWELRTSQQWLVTRGWERGSHVFIAPFHAFDNRERVAASAYYVAARGASANATVPDTLVFWQPDNPYELTGIDVDQLPYTSEAGRDHLRVILQRTLDEGRFVDVLFHEVPAGDEDELRATLDVIADFRDRVLPYHVLYPAAARPVG